MAIFAIRLERRFRLPLLLWGVLRRSAWVRLTEAEIAASFGFFVIRTPLANVERWEISGPYRWWRAIGMRGTWGRPEITFGGSTHGGIALFLRGALRRRWWIGRISTVYLTVDDLEGLAAELTRRGIPGQDARTAAN